MQAHASAALGIFMNEELSNPQPPSAHPQTPIAAPPPVQAAARVHPLDRADPDVRIDASESARIRVAWAKLVWLMAFLATLLAISYLVPYIAEQTQYAITRGKQRAEHDFAREHVGESPVGEMSRAYQMVSQLVGPSVVHINTTGASENTILPLSTRRTSRIPTEGQGSGVILDASGYVLTNHHVIRGASDIHVSLADGRRLKATVVGRDSQTDLAVLKIEADKLVPAQWGDSDSVEPGALVWAVGSPFGLSHTVTSGILSAKHRSGLVGSSQQDFLQTDAAVNPGNSGGPLVDASGKVIGINTAIVGEYYQGISFAIPSRLARDIFDRLKTEKVVRRGWLGVQLEEMTAQHAVDAGLSTPKGVYIAGLYLDNNTSPAAVAGIQPGDVLLSWNGAAVNSALELRRQVENTKIGSRAKVIVLRGGQEVPLEVVVGQRPEDLT
jgi:S1-C subfamily serine protease